MTDINIKETIVDESTDFNVKRFRIGNYKFEMPTKSLDINNTTHKLLDSNLKEITSLAIEKSKLLKEISPIKSILDSSDENTINSFFGKKNWAQDKFSSITISLKFNPLKYIKKIEDIEGFFDYYHSYSKDALFIPNIWHKASNDNIIDVENYLKYVDSVYHILNSRNGKPIFVPISIKFSLNDLDKIISYYLKKEHFYIWIDFESKPINQSVNAKLRRMNDLLRKSGQFDKIITYYSNIKREILSNVKDVNDSPGSDILASTMGANFIGVNRDPQKFNPNSVGKQPSPKDIWIHKARKFNPETYYYEKQEVKAVKPKNENITVNTRLLNDELKKQNDFFLEKQELGSYLQHKKMLIDNSEIFKSIIREKQKKVAQLKEFF